MQEEKDGIEQFSAEGLGMAKAVEVVLGIAVILVVCGLGYLVLRMVF